MVAFEDWLLLSILPHGGESLRPVPRTNGLSNPAHNLRFLDFRFMPSRLGIIEETG
jgi:hypothetical protein